MKVELPEKLYFKIGEVAKFADVAPHVIRYWESEFDKIKPKRANSRQRLFRREDVLLILEIKDLLHNQGFTISGARKFIAQGKKVSQEELREHSPVNAKSYSTKSSSHEELRVIKEELLEIRDLLTSK